MGVRAKTLGGGKRQWGRTFATRQSSEKYKEAQRFYASKMWRDLREQKLANNPLCEECLKLNVLSPTVDIDHIQQRDERPDLELDWGNLMSLCKPCHAIKTRREHSSDANNP